MATTLKARDLKAGDHVRPIGEVVYPDWGDGAFEVIQVDSEGLVITVDAISKRVVKPIRQRLNFAPHYEDGPLEYLAYDPGASLRGSKVTLFERVPEPKRSLTRLFGRK